MGEANLTIEEQRLIIRALTSIEAFFATVVRNPDLAGIVTSARATASLLEDDINVLRETFKRLDKERFT